MIIKWLFSSGALRICKNNVINTQKLKQAFQEHKNFMNFIFRNRLNFQVKIL